ncbi:MAG: TonB-dependent receptor, partial [Acidobacteria bacterium]|nr:TonB-dependent receptor [Acidobacteriota bacterium]
MRGVFALLACAGALWGQSFTGSLLGVISDTTGAVIPGAAVVVVSRENGERRTAQSTPVGQFSVTALPPGSYDLEVEAQGFRRFRRENLRVQVLQDVRVDVVLEPGTLTETVTITGETPLLETTNASVGQVIENARIVDLPLNGRNTLSLVSLTAGVQPGRAGQFGGQPVNENVYAQGNYAINSGLQSQSEALVDGVPNNVFLWNAPAFVPSVAAVQEFKVQTSTFSAEFGHTGGGIVNLTTKSGTNEFHGSVFEFLRNDNFDANNFFNNRSGGKKPAFTYNQFGFAIGGPVRLPKYDGRDRTFFFGNYEGFRQSQGRTVLATVPQPEQRVGDFSQTLNAAGNLIRVYDPATVRQTPGVGSGWTRDPFPSNRIPQSRFDPVSSKVINFWPAPNLPGDGPARINNYLNNPGVTATQDQYTTKIDHVFNQKHRIFGRYSYSRLIPGESDAFGTVPGARPLNPFEFNTALKIWSKSFALDHTWLRSSNLLLSFRYGFTRQRQFRDPASLGLDLKSLGFPKRFNDEVQIRTLPTFSLQGIEPLGEGGNVYFRRGDNVHSFQASGTRTLTRHSVKFGFELRAFLFNDARAPTASGSFSFNQGFTQADPLRANAVAGYSLASFLLGLPGSGSTQYFPAVSLNQNYYGLYVQDDFRVTQKLTLNLGLRWDLETPKTERFNRLSSFDPMAASPLAKASGLDLRGGLRFLGVADRSREQWEKDWNNFAPRFGFAYRITPRFVARGGYGIFFSQTVGQGGLVGNGDDGFGNTNTLVASNDGGVTPAVQLSNPFPNGLVLPSGASQGLLTLVGQDLRQWDSRFNTPYSQQYNFGLQYEFPGLFLTDVSYVGRHAIGIPIRLSINQMPAGFLSLGSRLLENVPNPIFGLIDAGPLAARTVTRNRLLRPYPQFNNIFLNTPIGQESFNSLQFKVERRFSRGFSALMSYTIAKSLTNSGGGGGGPFGFNTPSIQNAYDLRGERSLSPVDVSQRLVVSYLWKLPFGRGRAILGDASAVV